MRPASLAFFTALLASALCQDVPNVLIYGWAGSAEASAAAALGYNTTIVTDGEWANMTTDDFSRYDAVIIPDLNTDSYSSLDFLNQSKAVWSPAITGNMIVIGGDPVNHIGYAGAGILIRNAVRFAATHPSGPATGFYLVLSRIYNSVETVPVDVLSPFGNFTIRGNLACYDTAHLVASSPALDSLDDAALSNWGCSVHEAFSSYPTSGRTDFQALAIAKDVQGEGSQTFGDGSVGLPYIISHGATPAACGDGVWDQVLGEECDDGNTLDGDGCSTSCKCEAGLPRGDGTCDVPLPPPATTTSQPAECTRGAYGPKTSDGYGYQGRWGYGPPGPAK